jgi:hypothetical protein
MISGKGDFSGRHVADAQSAEWRAPGHRPASDAAREVERPSSRCEKVVAFERRVGEGSTVRKR